MEEWWKCPECQAVGPESQWEETATFCEDCGSHIAWRCPNCEEACDGVWNEPETVEPVEQTET